MNSKDKVICIFGGSGFLGNSIVQELARAGFRVKIATRYPESAYELKTYGDVGQIVPFYCNYRDEDSLKSAVAGSYAVINLVGVLFEKGKNKFTRVHRDLPEAIAKACTEQNIPKVVHLSALGIETSKSKYAQSKLAGEGAVLEAFPAATILRPSVVFGAGDNFFNMFAKMASFLPALPLIGGGKTKFQPVYVGDIADAVMNIVTDKAENTQGSVFQLAGPEVVSFKEIYQILLSEINRNCALVSVPWVVAKIQGTILGLLPKPLLTRDQVKSLQSDNVMDEDAVGLKELGVEPTAMRIILPRYLSNFKRGGRFGEKNDLKKVA